VRRHPVGRIPPPDGDELPRARILIVDDDERNGFAAVQALEDLGHELVVANSGEEALWRLLEDEFAVILLDLHMPGMDGYETAGIIRSRRRTRDIPIVFLTAIFRDEPHIFQAYSAGAVDVVFKPVDPFILRSKVQVLVDLFLKTKEVERQAAHRQRLLEENARVLIEKQTAERALRKTQERQEAILRCLPIVTTSRTVEPPFHPQFVSDNVLDLTGFPASRFTEEPSFGSSRIHPDDLETVVNAISGAVRTGAYSCEFRWLCADGTYRTFLDQGVLAPEEEGRPREIFGTLLDISDRRSLEEQLAQARKMEAVGQLTGGVAHDFNNLLTVVLGNVDLLSRRGDKDPKRERQLGAVRQAAERGRSLTKQLLAFSRRQQLSPVDLDVNQLIEGFAPLMRQAIGEAVTLEMNLGEGGLYAHVDATQLETALLNLAVNARDAMADGGTLTISTSLQGAPKKAGSSDGAWVRIEVRDTGSGMPREVLERVFEPFFTTKEVGKGSGLGLSQVYGFVRQSDGFITADSAPGEGTSFQILLKRSEAPSQVRKPAKTPRTAQRGHERLLVVEDDPTVLGMVVETLQGLGYKVVTAIDADSALAVLSKDDKIELLFSDVVMPGGTSGLQLARTAREMRPGLKVLLTSGYVGEAARVADEFPLIEKPYERAMLASRLRELLDAPPPQAEQPEQGRPLLAQA